MLIHTAEESLPLIVLLFPLLWIKHDTLTQVVLYPTRYPKQGQSLINLY